MTGPPPARVLRVSGDSGSGKTTLIRRLLVRLPRPPGEIAVVKHTHHAIGWHPAGKDSAELWDAGPGALAVAGPDQTAMFERREPAGPSGGPAASGARDGAEPSGADGTSAHRDGAAPGGDGDPAAATRRLVRVCRRVPARIRLILAEGFRHARAPGLWTAAGPPGPAPVPPGAVAVVVPAEHRGPWAEEHGGTEVFSRREVDAIAARVEEWAAPVGELPGG